MLAKQDIRRVIEALPKTTKSMVTLMVVGSLRIGEVAALRWERVHADPIETVERFYERAFDDTRPIPVAGVFRFVTVVPSGAKHAIVRMHDQTVR